jgi:cell division protein FtsL
MAPITTIQEEIRKLREQIAEQKGNVAHLEEKLFELSRQYESHRVMLEQETKRQFLRD